MVNADYKAKEKLNQNIVVEAEFVRQVGDGNHDSFWDVDEETFDAAPALDRIPFPSLPENAYKITEDGALNYGDDIYDAAVSVGIIKEWDGPYRVTIIDADAYREYRKRRERDELSAGKKDDEKNESLQAALAYVTVRIPRPENCWKCPLRGTWRRARHNEYYCKAVPCGRDREISNPMKRAAFCPAH